MTPQPHKKYIITEMQLEKFESEATNDYGECCLSDEILRAIRSRPAPSPIRSMREDEDGHISWQQMNEKALAEHDAAIAAQAREDVLNEFDDGVSIILFEHEYLDVSREFLDLVVELSNSLRSTGGDE